jgi:hypothetical protein
MLNKQKHKTEEHYIRGSSAHTNTIYMSFKLNTAINLYHPGTGILNLMLRSWWAYLNLVAIYCHMIE